MLFTFLKGLILGLSIAAPVGPIGVLCIRRTLAMGQRVGLVSGLGAATADGFYGFVAGFGLTTVADFLTAQAFWLKLIGGIFLCYLGVTTFLAKPAAEVPGNSQMPGDGVMTRSLLSAYGSTLALTLTNPATILSFAAIFVGLGLVESGQDYWASSILVLGVFLGSAIWWVFLSGMVSLFRTRLTLVHMRWLNRIAGVVLLTFGVVALLV